MIRQIKFRALSNGEWWYSDDEAYVLKDDNGVLKLYEDETFYNDKRRNLVEIGEAHQFTGLLDKNGKEIYESDLVNVWVDDEKHVAEVIYSGAGFCFNYGKEHEPYLGEVEFDEVIGNIYENKDLISHYRQIETEQALKEVKG